MLSLFLSVVDCSYQRVDGSADDIRIYACAPGKDSVRLFDAHMNIKNSQAERGCTTAILALK